ncbi:hypothetical protein KC328_g29 [Hortaea werneckii]|nr:hypothetical protein KC328_g29 [Hortaea werneckii]
MSCRSAEDDLVCADVRPWPIVEDFGDELGLRCDVQVIELFYILYRTFLQRQNGAGVPSEVVRNQSLSGRVGRLIVVACAISNADGAASTTEAREIAEKIVTGCIFSTKEVSL